MIDYIIVRCNDIKDILITRLWPSSKWKSAQPPPLWLQKLNKIKLNCKRLGNTEARNEFRHLLNEKLGESEPCLCSEKQWNNSGPISALCSTTQQPNPLAIRAGTTKTGLTITQTPSISCFRICTKHTGQLHPPWPDSILQEILRKVQRETHTMQNEWWIEKAHEIQSFANKNKMRNF